jgi:hypothetical protein
MLDSSPYREPQDPSWGPIEGWKYYGDLFQNGMKFRGNGIVQGPRHECQIYNRKLEKEDAQ